MKKINTILFTTTSLFLLLACNQENVKTDKAIEFVEQKVEKKTELKALDIPEYQQPHEYGGWYCPDNFGFKPVDIQNLHEVKVISNRLPTKDETRNGSSLIFVDSEKYPDAKALNIKLPQVAKIYIHHKAMWETIIVIQAVVVKGDTIVGYRFPSGGNGSAWFNEITFLDNNEINNIGGSPFTYSKLQLNASKEKVWNAFTKTKYAKELGVKFKQEEFFQSKWKSGGMAYLDYKTEETKATGKISEAWGNIYLQIDYLSEGEHYTEKMLIMENNESGKTDFHFTAGPIVNNFDSKNKDWMAMTKRVEELSEAKQSFDFIK